jgi:hypothetical protein
MTGCAMRTAVSAGPPGGNGTMILIGFDGNAWAAAPRGSGGKQERASLHGVGPWVSGVVFH